MKKLVKNLPEREVRSNLYHFLLQISLLEEKDYPKDKLLDDLRELYQQILYPEDQPVEEQISKYKQVHICCGNLGGSLGQVFKEIGINKDEHIISFHDNFAIGPVADLHEEKGAYFRYKWLKNNISYTEEFNYMENFQRTINQIHSIPKDIPITIWVSDNAHEQTGLLFTITLLKGKTNSIFIRDVEKLYRLLFQEKAKKYTIRSSGEILLEDLKEIYQYGKENQIPLTLKERADLGTMWESLSNNQNNLRLWVNEEIINVSEEYYDAFIISIATKLLGKKKEFIKAARIIGEVLGRLEQYVGDEFLEYRLKKLIEKGVFEYEGDLDAMIFYSVKLKK